LNKLLALLLLCRRLQRIAKIVTEFLCKFLLPIANRLQATEEEAENLRLFNPFQSTDELAIVIQPFNTVGTILYLRQREYTTRTCETEKFKLGITLSSVWLALFRQSSTFHSTNTTSDV